MRILSIHDGINSSVALLEDGKLLWASQEERYISIKNYIGFPQRAIDSCLNYLNLSIDQIDEIALATYYVLRSPGQEGRTTMMSVRDVIKNYFQSAYTIFEDTVPKIKQKAFELFRPFVARRSAKRIAPIRERLGFDGPISIIDHHWAHAASAYYSCPWKDEPVLVLTKDAAGDALCSTVNIGENGAMTRVAETIHTHSLGYLYSAMTRYFGMTAHEHEYKITGLAPYASEKHGKECYNIFKSYLGLSPDGLRFERKVFEALHYPYIRRRINRDFEFKRFDNIAWGLQTLTEELISEWVQNCIKKTGIHKVAAAGGVFANIKANKRIIELPELDDFFVMPSPGDESTSIGAAYALYAQRQLDAGQELDIQPLGDLYLGDDFTEIDIQNAIKLSENSPFDYERSKDIGSEIADIVLKGGVITRVDGRMEFGARALGNRSILCDASDLRVIRELNSTIKMRDFWMPYSPVIRHHRQHDYLINPKNIALPYMTIAVDTTDEREDIRAALHQQDFTARPQVLKKDWNPEYDKILQIYEEETGRGGLLNTSANIHGEPIVRGPYEALSMFLRSGLKYLALGDYLFTKK